MAKFSITSSVGEFTALHLYSGFAPASLAGVGHCVALTQALGTPITPGVQTVPVSNVSQLYAGQLLNIAQGVGNPYEDVRVLAVNQVAKTFTAQFVNGYSGTITITSRVGSYLGGIVVNKAGSGVAITLSNGHPNIQPTPTDPRYGVFAILDPTGVTPFWYWAICEFGLFVSMASTTIGDYSLMYRDMIV